MLGPRKGFLKNLALVICPALLVCGCANWRSEMELRARGPIIDVHLHTVSVPPGGALPPNPVTGKRSAARSDEEAMREVLAEMERFDIVKGVVSGPLDAALEWKRKAPDKFLSGVVSDSEPILPSLERLREEFEPGRLSVLGELTLQYAGIAPNDPRLEPYFALAEELDIPVAVHTGSGPPETAQHGAPNFRIWLGNPLLLEDVLVRHPKLRVWLCHGGADFLHETTMLMHQYPRVYADIAVINWIGGMEEREWFHGYLKSLIQSGLGKRVMFGSDQMMWPDAIGLAIEAVDSATFLTREQKRDIFYNNAARFFKIDPEIRSSLSSSDK